MVGDRAPSESGDEGGIEVARLFAVMGNTLRLRLLVALVERPHSVSELITRSGERQAAVSQQLAVLRNHGVVEATRLGKTASYRLTDARVSKILAAMTSEFAEP